MKLIASLKAIQAYSRSIKAQGLKIGLVPTMGFLHAGHLSLVRAARRDCNRVVVSIFVNPIQFGPSEDYKNYPRNLRRDLNLLKKERVDLVFYPKAQQMFPKDFKTYIEVEDLSQKLCGKTRPTHFCGVTTVVAKLLNLVQPDVAYFGKKDFQQQLIIKKMVKDLNSPARIVSLPTVREPKGLAMSSRNIYLNPSERKAAAVLYKSLRLASTLIKKGEKSVLKIKNQMLKAIQTERRIKLDYLSICDPDTLEELKTLKRQSLIALAAYAGRARLIDNILVKS